MKYIRQIFAPLLALLLLTSCGADIPEAPAEISALTEQQEPASTAEGTFPPSTTRPMTTTTRDANAPAATSSPLPDGVAETDALAPLFARDITHILIQSGRTGSQYTVLEGAEIARIAAFCAPIEGTSPESNRGYYGFYYSVTVYSGPIEVGHFTFMGENMPGNAAYTTGHFETVDGHDYAIRYRMSGRTTAEVLDFFDRYFPTDFTTTADPTPDTAQDWSEAETTTAGFDYDSLILPDYRTANPVRYRGTDSRGEKTDGWQDFGAAGELRTVPQPMGSTYLYQTYSYFIRNDLTHLYPRDPLPTDPEALAEWLTDIRKSRRRALWFSMGILPSAVELTAYETITADSGAILGRATYLLDGQKWVVYILCEESGSSVMAILPNEDADYVYRFTDGIAQSYRIKADS